MESVMICGSCISAICYVGDHCYSIYCICFCMFSVVFCYVKRVKRINIVDLMVPTWAGKLHFGCGCPLTSMFQSPIRFSALACSLCNETYPYMPTISYDACYIWYPFKTINTIGTVSSFIDQINDAYTIHITQHLLADLSIVCHFWIIFQIKCHCNRYSMYHRV